MVLDPEKTHLEEALCVPLPEMLVPGALNSYVPDPVSVPLSVKFPRTISVWMAPPEEVSVPPALTVRLFTLELVFQVTASPERMVTLSSESGIPSASPEKVQEALEDHVPPPVPFEVNVPAFDKAGNKHTDMDSGRSITFRIRYYLQDQIYIIVLKTDGGF